MKRFLRNLAAIYGPAAPARLTAIYRRSGGPFGYLGRYWTTQYFTTYTPDRSEAYRPVRMLLSIGMTLQLLLGIILVYTWTQYGTAGFGYLGAALILSYPIVWAQVLFVAALAWNLLHLKRYGKAVLCGILERQVIELRRRNDFTLIAVAGSVGKTSTKLAVAELLAGTKRVRYQEGNYNDRLTVPLVLFNVSEPGLYDVRAWLKIYVNNRRKLRQPYPFDVAVVELGTDGPGQMADFAYLRPDLCVVTAVAEEHMEHFGTLDAVAAEELTVFDYSTQLLMNTDDVAARYLAQQSYVSYGTQKGAEYHAKLAGSPGPAGQKLTLQLRDSQLTVQTNYFGEQGAKIVLAAAAVGHMLELDKTQLKAGLGSLKPFAGRLQVLKGIEDTTLLDDTYNASPNAVKAALDVLYNMETKQRIAVLGSMNELGVLSSKAHAEIGRYCDPAKLDLVVTIGREAKKHLAPAAKARGCEVKSFTSPNEAGTFLREQLKRHATVLFKGSQNGVFAEEALKPLLADPADASKLVRQSEYWMNIKRAQFGE